MSDTLLIHYNINQPQHATWSLCNDAGELTGKITSGTLEELSEFAKETSHATVLLNSQCLHINQLQLPAMNQQKMLKAVPFAIEEFIAEDIEGFHFVISKNKHNSKTSVVGIEKTTLENIIGIFQQADIKVEKIIPDALCLAANDKQWSFLNYLDNTYLQTDVLNGMLLPHEILSVVISQKLKDEEQSTPEKILLFNEQENSTAFDQLQADLKDMLTEDDATEIVSIVYNNHPLVVFCGNYKQAAPLNLLQNEFKPKRKSSGYLQHWRLAASLSAIWLVLSLSITGYQHSQIKSDNVITNAKIEKIYKTAFPKSRKIINPRLQMEQKLKELKSGGGGSNTGLIYLLAESFGTLGSDKSNITLQTLTFRNDRMDIGLDSNNLQAIENLNNNLNSNAKIKSEITSSSSEKDKVKGNLRIEGRS